MGLGGIGPDGKPVKSHNETIHLLKQLIENFKKQN
jgi:hypothetical protein